MIDWFYFWRKKGVLNYLLLPFSSLFFLISCIRRFGYQKGFFKSYQAHIPVVVVGNIMVGGGGKTPLIIALAKLLESRGIHVAIISRGYKGLYSKEKKYHIVNKDDDANYCGDEALLIHLKTACPVIVCADRYLATLKIKEHYKKTNVILLDDGLQHYRLKRDIEIITVPSECPFGNGFLLPAGPLREWKKRLSQVDFVIESGGQQSNYNYYLEPAYWQHINDYSQQKVLNYFYHEKNVLAFCGIANPNRFKTTLQHYIYQFEFKFYPDHYHYTSTDLPKDRVIVVTEKDAIKLKKYSHLNTYMLVCEAVLSKAFEVDFLNELDKRLVNEN